MLAAILRPLALCCGMLLLLPPGWCCLLAQLARPCAAAGLSAKPKRACCGHCGGKRDNLPAPASDHVPGRDGKCPCGERLATAPAVPESAGSGLALPAPVAVAPSDTTAPAAVTCETPAEHSDPPHYHVLNCVWLC
jgi:hypothetical protein